jgi:ABC-type branched-subunit amino acid transport system ATPase component
VTEELLRTDSLEVSYGSVAALRGVSLSVHQGDSLTVLGANGAGKSTLARACSGLVPACGGRIWFCGQDITGWPAHRVRRAGLVHLPEGRGVFPGLSVLDNLRMAVMLADRSERKSAIERAFELFPELSTRRSQRAGHLSGGEQQMLSLARGLAIPPKLLIADELSLGLAPQIVDRVFQALEKAKELGITTVLIEQFVHRALSISDRCAILRRGQLVWSGPADVASERTLSQYIGDDTSKTASDPAAGRPAPHATGQETPPSVRKNSRSLGRTDRAALLWASRRRTAVTMTARRGRPVHTRVTPSPTLRTSEPATWATN